MPVNRILNLRADAHVRVRRGCGLGEVLLVHRDVRDVAVDLWSVVVDALDDFRQDELQVLLGVLFVR